MAFWNKKEKDILDNTGEVHQMPTPKPRKRNFLAAIKSRLTGDWHSGIMAPDREIEGAAVTLRGRSRDLVKNNAYASRFVDLLQIYVIGSDGIKLRLKDVIEGTGEKIQKAWDDWGQKVTIDGKMGWLEFTQLVVQLVAMDGELFIRKIFREDMPFGFALQAIDADFLDNSLNINKTRKGTVIRQGIEMDEDGKIVAYHFYSRHPQDSLTPVRDKGKRIIVPADQIIHVYKPDRAGQTRGIPWMTPIMYSLHMLGEALRFELVASRTSAGKMGFITKTAEAAPDVLDDLDADQELDAPRDRLMEVGPGQLVELDFGENFQAWNPEHPNTAFEPMTKLILRQIASGVNVSYGSLASDLSDTSYSSGRIGSVLERDHFKNMQNWFAMKLHNEVYEAWLEAALLSGDLKIGTRNITGFVGPNHVIWQGRSFIWIDPEKDLKAYERAIANGLADRTTVLDASGGNVNDVFANLAKEQELAEELGIDIDGVMGDQKEEETPARTRAPWQPLKKRGKRPITFGDETFADFEECTDFFEDDPEVDDPAAFCAFLEDLQEDSLSPEEIKEKFKKDDNN
jgi:lambda family phage portal protein